MSFYNHFFALVQRSPNLPLISHSAGSALWVLCAVHSHKSTPHTLYHRLNDCTIVSGVFVYITLYFMHMSCILSFFHIVFHFFVIMVWLYALGQVEGLWLWAQYHHRSCYCSLRAIALTAVKTTTSRRYQIIVLFI